MLVDLGETAPQAGGRFPGRICPVEPLLTVPRSLAGGCFDSAPQAGGRLLPASRPAGQTGGLAQHAPLVPDPRRTRGRPPGGKSPLPAAPPRESPPGNMTDPPYPLGARRPTAPRQACRNSHAPLRRHGGPRADEPRKSASGDANPRTETVARAWRSDARDWAASS